MKVIQPWSKDANCPPRLEEARIRFSLSTSGGRRALLTLWFWNSGLQIPERIHVHCFKLPSLYKIIFLTCCLSSKLLTLSHFQDSYLILHGPLHLCTSCASPCCPAWGFSPLRQGDQHRLHGPACIPATFLSGHVCFSLSFSWGCSFLLASLLLPAFETRFLGLDSYLSYQSPGDPPGLSYKAGGCLRGLCSCPVPNLNHFPPSTSNLHKPSRLYLL